jgi:HAE1 family hydrophobic/amphiphilic exporter-1
VEWCFDPLLAIYDRGLVIALRHRFITLMTMLARVALTGWLFVVIPKGFFPEQDTGLILGITEAAEDISPAGMSTIQQQVLGVVLKDPAVDTAGTISARAVRPRPRIRGVYSSLSSRKPSAQRSPQ